MPRRNISRRIRGKQRSGWFGVLLWKQNNENITFIFCQFDEKRNQWELPKGGREDTDATSFDTARRELWEEGCISLGERDPSTYFWVQVLKIRARELKFIILGDEPAFGESAFIVTELQPANDGQESSDTSCWFTLQECDNWLRHDHNALVQELVSWRRLMPQVAQNSCPEPCPEPTTITTADHECLFSGSMARRLDSGLETIFENDTVPVDESRAEDEMKQVNARCAATLNEASSSSVDGTSTEPTWVVSAMEALRTESQCLPLLSCLVVLKEFTYEDDEWRADSFLCLKSGETVSVRYLGFSNSYNEGWCYGFRDVEPTVEGWFPECAVLR